MEKFNRTEDTKAEGAKVSSDQAGSGGAVAGPAGADPPLDDQQAGDINNLSADAPSRTKSRSATVSTQNRPPLTTNASTDDRKPSGEGEAWAQWELDEMEQLLHEVRGHLVMYSTRFLEAEDLANNFLFNVSTCVRVVKARFADGFSKNVFSRLSFMISSRDWDTIMRFCCVEKRSVSSRHVRRHVHSIVLMRNNEDKGWYYDPNYAAGSSI
jgi:hypothetical protein